MNEQISQMVSNFIILWMILVGQITDDLPNFVPTKLSHNTVIHIYAFIIRNGSGKVDVPFV